MGCYYSNYAEANSTGLAVLGVGLRPLASWDFGFESRGEGGDVCVSLVSVVCCQINVCASDWSLVQRSPTEYGVWVWSCSLDMKAALSN